ncbi:MAG: metal-dependent transcriptional regulator [Planctomycetota bacterium]
MATSTVEDYVKAIYLLQNDAPTGEATVARLAATLGVTKGSVTSMVRKLREAKLADSERYGGIRLTRRGRDLAIDMIRRHRLIEVFLVETLGFDWAEVHEEAERLEHALSKKVLDRLDAFLGRPSIDPHGDPIPDAQGKLEKGDFIRLSELSTGDQGEVARVSDQDPGFLAFAAQHGLKPGTRFGIVAVVPEAESLSVKAERKSAVSLSFAAASKIWVSTA